MAYDQTLLMVLILICFVGICLFLVNRKNGKLGNAICSFGAVMAIIAVIIRINYEYHPMTVIRILYVVFLMASVALIVVGAVIFIRNLIKKGNKNIKSH